ncbi:CYTH domain-containing protein [Salegentibacter salegens]|uniref:CYTH domain-containing protein n=1 Tax=Salegentibacter salegens TaxID=143223 RepID=A0A1M7M6T0_9FLAO|nr:CYTH domain-containing protein [Salegentibacter salegens]PRX51520.1 CYTH domain-containing protein [Salegentibacter salegens]SHM86350.1 CYTH domain-containing protein [Salegentibacter salegens]
MQEIERKYLVLSQDFKKESYENFSIKQGFLNTDPERTVRLRITGNKAFITIKGKSSKNGLTRFEWEKEIDIKEAEALFNLCEPGIIEKTRYLVKSGDFVFEIDEFYGENEGLTVAEIELNNETDTFQKPEWLGEEVTGDIKYYNSQLSKNPYENW